MVEGKRKSRSLRRVFRKTPGGKTVVHYKIRKPGKPQCAECGKVLSGTPNINAYNLKKMSKSSKRPERPYGGNLCSSCMRKKMIKKARD